MAEMGWTSQVAAAAGAAAGTGAAQLGLGYGLGVVVWPVAATPDDNVWLGSLGWATWITASATVIGAVIASRLRSDSTPRPGGLWRLALATSAAVGALVAVALIALPARSAVRTDTFSPQITAGSYALLGVVLGLFVAYWAVASRPVAANLIGTACWLWALAIAAIVVELSAHRTSATYLTSWQFAEAVEGFRYGSINWPSGLLTLAAAFLVGLVAAAPAARRGDLGVGATISGAVGPLLVAAAFLALAPQLSGSLGPLESAYLIAPYAVLAGLAGSALAVSIGRAAVDRRARRAESADAEKAADAERPDKTDEPDAADVTATGIAAVPAAEPAASPSAIAPKTKAPPSTGRAKLPTQATDSRPGPAATNTRSGLPAADAGSGRPPASRSADAPAAPAVPAAAPAAGTGTPPGKRDPEPASKPAAAGRNGQSAAPAVDPEIAAAARPGRARPKRPAPAESSKPKSTVTPPPTDPTVARINPKPTADS
jgi:hypothetical protein